MQLPRTRRSHVSLLYRCYLLAASTTLGDQDDQPLELHTHRGKPRWQVLPRTEAIEVGPVTCTSFAREALHQGGARRV